MTLSFSQPLRAKGEKVRLTDCSLALRAGRDQELLTDCAPKGRGDPGVETTRR
jgi:hypothetical protein